MDVNGLRAPLGALRKCHIRQHSPIVTIRGRVMTCCPSFPHPSIHLSGGFGFKPWKQQKNYYLCEGTIPMLMLTFLSHFLPIQLDWYFISHDGTTFLPFCSVQCPITPAWVNFLVRACFVCTTTKIYLNPSLLLLL